MTIKADGYQTYQNESEVDQPNIDLDLIIMLTKEQAEARDAKRRQRVAH